MTKEEYKLKLLNLRNKYEILRSEIDKQYAFPNNAHKIGDIIEDHKEKIEIINCRNIFAFNSEFPEIIYEGFRLKKNNERFKNNEISYIYQSNIKKNIKEAL